MKRKIFSKLLMVAMLVASVSMFVSCKDYDDDIKKNSDAISSLQQTLNNLQSALDQAKSDAATAHATFATKVELGQVDAAVKALQDEIKTLATKKALEDAIADVNAAMAKNATKEELEALSTKLAAIDEKLAGDLTAYKETTDAAITTANENIKKQEEALAALATLVATKADKTALEEAVKALEAAIKAGDDKNATAISDLKTALEKAISEGDAANKALIDALTKVVGTKADATALAAAVEKLEAAIATKASQADLDKLSKTVDSKATIKSVEDLSTALTEQIAAAVEDIADINEKLETMAGDINDVKDAMKDADDAVRKDIGDQINLLQAFLLKRLTSLVLKPSFYWEGLEGIEVPFLEAEVYKWKSDTTETYVLRNPMVNPGTEVTIKGTMGILQRNNNIFRLVDTQYASRFDGATATDLEAPSEYIQFENEDGLYKSSDWKAYGSSTVGDSVVFISNGGVAYYHVNPATADLSGSSLSFFTNLAEVHTRYASDHDTAVEPKEKDAAKNKITNGIMEVPFKINNLALARFYWDYGYVDADRDRTTTSISHMGLGGYGRNVEYNDTLPFIALQCGTRDTIVTSDYAVLTPARYQIVALADTAAYYNGIDENTFDFDDSYLKRANHLDTVAIEAIDNVAIHPVAWNGQIDLKPFIQTHYKYWSLARYDKNTVLNEQIMDDATMEALGLHYEFYPITYTKGANGTDETAHITQQGDKTSGLFKANEVDDNGARLTSQNRNSIGREPLVRVDLVDEKGNIIEYGFIKLRIVDTVTTGFHVDINLNDIYMNCGDSAAVTWAQMENLILSKIGSNGITKKEFEAQYFLDVVKYAKDATDGKMTDDTRGKKLYQSDWWARRYYQNAKGKYVTYYDTDVDDDKEESSNDEKEGTAAKYDLVKNWFGRVWYTPHDVDNPHDWDPQTNVLVWSMQTTGVKPTTAIDGYAADVEKGRVTAGEIAALTKLAKISSASLGLNTEELSTTVCFKKKNDKTGSNSIYVTLHFQPGKIHFQYSSVANKDLHHWYQFNTVTPGTQSDIDVRANVPTPAEVGAENAASAPWLNHDNDAMYTFNKDLLEYWQNHADIVQLNGEKAKFSKFYTEDGKEQNITAGFRFTLPVEGVNSTISYTTLTGDDKITTTGNQGTSKTYDKVWYVKGISGSTWTLALDKSSVLTGDDDKDDMAIVAIAQDGKVLKPVQKIAEFYKTNGSDEELNKIVSRVHYYGDAEKIDVYGKPTKESAATKANDAATDLLNQMGYRDATGEKNEPFYLQANIDRAFTAYVEIYLGDEPCYAPFISDNYFNVKWQRPINVWPNAVAWTDGLNKMETTLLSDLVSIADWRDYPVIAADQVDTKVTEAVYHGKAQWNKAKTYTEGITPYQYYNITDLSIIRDQMRSDAFEEYDVRNGDPVTSVADILKYPTIDKISALTSADYSQHYLKLYDGDGNEVDKDSDNKFTTGKADFTSFGKITYNNNGGGAQIFHIYVPIAVKYAWGNVQQKFTSSDTSENINKNKDYTQTVWAVITVKKTTGSSGHE